MTWGPFSAEAVRLDSKLRRLHREGRVTDAVGEIEKALRSAHHFGPSNESYEAFEARLEASGTQDERENRPHSMENSDGK